MFIRNMRNTNLSLVEFLLWKYKDTFVFCYISYDFGQKRSSLWKTKTWLPVLNIKLHSAASNRDINSHSIGPVFKKSANPGTTRISGVMISYPREIHRKWLYFYESIWVDISISINFPATGLRANHYFPQKHQIYVKWHNTKRTSSEETKSKFNIWNSVHNITQS